MAATLLLRLYRFWTFSNLLDIVVAVMSLSLAAFLSYRAAFAFLLISFIVLRFGGLSLADCGSIYDCTDQTKRSVRNIKDRARNDRRNLSKTDVNLTAHEDQVAVILPEDIRSNDATASILLKDRTEPNQLNLSYSLFDDTKKTDVSLAELLGDIRRGALKFYDDINITHAFFVRGKHYLEDHKKVCCPGAIPDKLKGQPCYCISI